MKSVADARPSGDRQMARQLTLALEAAGHRVEQICRFSSFDGGGDARRQRRLAALGTRLAEALLVRLQRRDGQLRPDLWFTYHLYHKAPDWLGPPISRGLAIPYVVAEASHAAKQASGPWSEGQRAAASAIAIADLVIGINSADTEGILPLLRDPGRLMPLAPFIDVRPFLAAAARRQHHRRDLGRRLGLEPAVPWLLTVAMMRPGDKLASYRVLARALARIDNRPWRLLIAGDGAARADVHAALEAVGHRICWLGIIEGDFLAAVYAASDVYVWPAIGEAYGMTFLEAQAAGLPVVAGRSGGVGDVVAEGEGGVLVAAGDDAAFAGAIARLLDDAESLPAMGERAQRRVCRHHDVSTAAAALDGALRRVRFACERWR